MDKLEIDAITAGAEISIEDDAVTYVIIWNEAGEDSGGWHGMTIFYN